MGRENCTLEHLRDALVGKINQMSEQELDELEKLVAMLKGIDS